MSEKAEKLTSETTVGGEPIPKEPIEPEKISRRQFFGRFLFALAAGFFKKQRDEYTKTQELPNAFYQAQGALSKLIEKYGQEKLKMELGSEGNLDSVYEKSSQIRHNPLKKAFSGVQAGRQRNKFLSDTDIAYLQGATEEKENLELLKEFNIALERLNKELKAFNKEDIGQIVISLSETSSPPFVIIVENSKGREEEISQNLIFKKIE